MELHEIRYFLALSKTLNFTKAAEICNVSQPALTRAIQKMEDELGGLLFSRERYCNSAYWGSSLAACSNRTSPRCRSAPRRQRRPRHASSGSTARSFGWA